MFVIPKPKFIAALPSASGGLLLTPFQAGTRSGRWPSHNSSARYYEFPLKIFLKVSMEIET